MRPEIGAVGRRFQPRDSRTGAGEAPELVAGLAMVGASPAAEASRPLFSATASATTTTGTLMMAAAAT